MSLPTPPGRRAGRRRAVCARACRALALGAALAAGPAAAEPADRFDTVVLDAGHGGDDQGARGRDGLLEKELVLDVTQRLRRRLETHGIRVVLTRDRDVYVPLQERTAIANAAGADLFVSVHANAAPSSAARGIETFFLSLEASDEAASQVAARENAAFPDAPEAAAAPEDDMLSILGDLAAAEQMHESDEFARLAQASVERVDGSPSRGVKQAPFVVLMGLAMPASLVEIGFVSNPADEEALGRDARRDEIATALAEAVLEFGRRYDARRGVRERAVQPEGPGAAEAAAAAGGS